LFFNHLKHGLHVEHLCCRNENGLMVEIYSALILYLLTQIVIAGFGLRFGHYLLWRYFALNDCIQPIRRTNVE